MSGHIRRRGENSWELKFDTGRDARGARGVRYMSFKGTKRAAAARLTELLGESARGTLVDASKETLRDFLSRWDRDWAVSNVSPKTMERYRQLIANQIVKHLGNMPVQKIKPAHLNTLYATLLRAGSIEGEALAAQTVGHCHRLLRRALGHAAGWGIIASNPAALVHPPRVTSAEIEIISEDEVKVVLDTLRDTNPALRAIAVLALGSGMRRGELCAVRWQDVDLDAGKVKIERSLEQTGAGSSGLRFKEPKTKRSRRTVTIPGTVAADLRAHWKAVQEQRLALGLGRSAPGDLVFAMWNGEPRKPNTLTNDWLRATAVVGRKISLHALRHTHASQLIAAGVDILTISRRLGHASAKITLDTYGHRYGSSSDDLAAQATEKMFARIGRESSRSAGNSK